MSGATISLQELAEIRGASESLESADAIIDAVDDRWQALLDARASGVDLGTICRIAVPVLDLLRALCSLTPSSNVNVQATGNGCGCGGRCGSY